MRLREVTPLAAAVSLALCACDQQASDNADSAIETAQVGDCYKQAGPDFKQPRSERALFVIVDQTTGLDDQLRETVTDNVKRLLQPGTSYAVYTFSAYSRGHYATEILSGELPAPVPAEERPNLSVRRLNRFDHCLATQEKQAVSEVEMALEEATSASSSSFANSEIFASLQQLAEAVRNSQAQDKLVLVVSDLLEHSSTTSFYRKKTLRPIDVETELKKTKDKGMLADFGGANVAIVGAGLLSPESAAEAGRDTAALKSLHEFWNDWFEESDAAIVEYGQPDLVTPPRWGRTDKS